MPKITTMNRFVGDKDLKFPTPGPIGSPQKVKPNQHDSRLTRGRGNVRHSMQLHERFFSLAAITAVLSFLLAITGVLDLPTKSAHVTEPGVISHAITLSDLGDSDFVGIRLALSAETVVAAENDRVGHRLPSSNKHCPMNLGLSVACPDVLSSAVAPSSVPGEPGSAYAGGTPAQPTGAIPEVPGAPLHPVSLIRLSISRV